jgi:pyruvate/2-oxoglutarate/acetoin dehydrogenase E1 component
VKYGEAIREATATALAQDDSVMVIGQGLWSPWYVGNTMKELEAEFGKDRIIDTPVSELASTGMGVGAALTGSRPIVCHPRVDFALLALDQIVNQAAKWNAMFGGGIPLPVVFRLIVNRGGEQGAQHSQSLYSWFAHIPGLRVLLPSNPRDAGDMLLSAVMGSEPVVYIDDRWLYDIDDDSTSFEARPLAEEGPRVDQLGTDVTVVGMSWTTQLAREAIALLGGEISVELIDLRVVNPLKLETVLLSVEKTGRLLVLEGDWQPCGVGSEILAWLSESLEPGVLRTNPRRMNLPFAPAPTSVALEREYYPTALGVVDVLRRMIHLDGR